MRMANTLLASLVALIMAGAVLAPTAHAATITIVNNDGAGEGFNDPTVVAPIGGNPATTVGAQRLYLFQYAANIWGSLLPSSQVILVRAQFDPQTCTATSAVLGSAGPVTIHRDFGGAPFTGHWYHAAEANMLSSSDLSPANPDINATFNSNLNGSPTCLGGQGWYYGVDGNEGTNIELLPVLLHEMGHGLGFSTSTSGTSGNYNSSFPTIFDKFLWDATTGQHWDSGTTAGQRAASAISCGGLRWDGPSVSSHSLALLGPRPNLHTNAPIVVDMAVGEAAFGSPLSAGSVTGPVTLVNDGVAAPSLTDACEAMAPGSLTGQIALVDRGTCGFVIKVKNCQDAGAIAVIVSDNVAGCPPAGLGGADPTITIPAVRVTLADGNTLKANLAGLNVTLAVNPALKAGSDNSGRVLMYTPNPFVSGSSVSHWDVSATPNLLMEPAINNDLSQNVDLTINQMADIGWIDPATPIFVAPGHVLAGYDGVRIEFYSGKALEGTWTSYRLNDGIWTAIGSPEIQGKGLLILKDSNVKPGETYSYRLGALDNTTHEQTFSETVTVTIPTTVAFALDAVRNPAGRELTMAYTLGGVAPARLMLYNIAGRSLRTLDLSGMGLGRHTVDLGAGMALRPGTYFVKLVQGDRVATRPVVVQ
ncbi:MAG: PA domain-containing protein [Candidatus Eisenbacteria bacterium]